MIFSRGYGSANFTDPKAAAPDESTVTRIASITKTVTGLQLAHLRDAGVVGMDDPVAKYTPGFSVKTPYNTTRPITLRELASHTSGLERENPCGQTCNETEVLAAIARHYVVAPQHHRPHYSNLGYSLLGRTLGHAAGVSYEEYVTDKMLKPLGCPEATFAFNEYVKSHIAVGVDNAGDTVPVGGDSWNEGWDAPCGGLYASAADMAEYMKLMLRRDVPAGGLGGAQILDSATVEEVLKPAILLRDGEAAFGFPWEFQYVGADQHGHWARSKAGELSGYRSQVALIPELGLGMFASAFRSDVTPFDASDTVWTLPALSQLIEPVTALLAAAQPAPTLPADAGVYIGTYGPQDSRMVISADGQQLVGDFAGQAVLLSVFDGAGDGEHVLRAKLAKPGDTACRWLDDGSNLERECSRAGALPMPMPTQRSNTTNPPCAVQLCTSTCRSQASPPPVLTSWAAPTAA